MYSSANHPLSQSVDWIAKGAAQRSRTEGALLPARRSAPEHYPYMTSEHSTTVRWIRLGVDFEEGGNRSARGKPSKSGWDRLKLSPHTTFVVEVEGVVDVHYASLTSQAVQHGVFYPDGHPSRYQPRPTECCGVILFASLWLEIIITRDTKSTPVASCFGSA